MADAAAFIADTNAIAREWARAQSARTMVRAAMNSRDVIYRRTWPSKESIDHMIELGYDPKLACDGWLDSTIDLRDGLSVVEVFAAADEPRAMFETMGAPRF